MLVVRLAVPIAGSGLRAAGSWLEERSSWNLTHGLLLFAGTVCFMAVLAAHALPAALPTTRGMQARGVYLCTTPSEWQYESVCSSVRMVSAAWRSE